MIDKQYGKHELICDICGKTAPKRFEYWDEAVDYKKQNGWKSKRDGANWLDLCPDCGGL